MLKSSTSNFSDFYLEEELRRSNLTEDAQTMDGTPSLLNSQILPSSFSKHSKFNNSEFDSKQLHLLDKPSKKDSFFDTTFRVHWLRIPLFLFFGAQTVIGVFNVSFFVSLYHSLNSLYNISLFQIAMSAVYFFLGILLGCPLLFFFRKYLSLTNCLRFTFVFHAIGSLLLVFIRTSFIFVFVGQLIIGFCCCFYTHHQSEFCLHWFPSKTRRMVGSVLSVFVYLSLGSSNIFPTVFIGTFPSQTDIEFLLKIICIITASLSILLLIFFREKPPKGYGKPPVKELAPQEILDSNRTNSLSVKNMESINPVPPLSPRTSHLTPLPDLAQFNLCSLLFKYSKNLLQKKSFTILVLLFAFNNSSLAVLCVFSNMLAGYSEIPSYHGSLNVIIITIGGLCSTLIHSLTKPNFFHQAVLLFFAFISLISMLYFLYTK